LYSINGNDVYIGWNPQDTLPANAYYVLLEGNDEGTEWQVKEIYNHPIKGRSNEKQEILFVDREFSYIQPFFETYRATHAKVEEGNASFGIGANSSNKYKSYNNIERGTWECNFISGDKTYNPCTSRLCLTNAALSIGKSVVSVINLGLTSGTHKGLDKEKMVEVVTKSNLFESIKKSPVYKKEL
jgi:hypothetical protein